MHLPLPSCTCSTIGLAGYTPPSGLQAVSDDMAKNLDPEIDTKRAASAATAWGGNTPMETAATAVAEAPAASGQQQQQQKSSTAPLKVRGA